MSDKREDFFSDLFKTISKEVGKIGGEVGDMFNATGLGTKVPAINIIETGEAFEVEVAAPGMSKEEFSIGLEDNALIIAAATDAETPAATGGRKYLQREFDFGNFKRSFKIPETAEVSKISASYKEGVLVISIPKKESAKSGPVQEIKIW